MPFYLFRIAFAENFHIQYSFLTRAQRCPADEGDVIEIRQIFDQADFAIKK